MRTIVIANAKGGSGKSTLAVNLASYFACWGIRVGLVDSDRQGSALAWLKARSPERPAIEGIRVAPGGDYQVPGTCDYVIIDVPSGLRGQELIRVAGLAESIVVPVLPSPIDIRAGGHFIAELMEVPSVRTGRTRVCAVANRVRQNTIGYRRLERFLASLGIPFIARLRDTQNYIHAAEQGLGLFEFPARQVGRDMAEWQPLVAWLTLDERLGVVPPIEPAFEAG